MIGSTFIRIRLLLLTYKIIITNITLTIPIKMITITTIIYNFMQL